MEFYYTYILYSKDIDKYYIGSSSNPSQRLKFHNLGKSGGKNSFTKRASDWNLLFTKKFNSKSAAFNFEKYIKSQKSRKFIENLIDQD